MILVVHKMHHYTTGKELISLTVFFVQQFTHLMFS